MKQFNENFYTDDFDQEMIDFLLQKGYAVTGASRCMKPDLHNDYLNYGTGVDCFWTDEFSNIFSERLTKQEFKAQIGMTKEESCEKQPNTFTKQDLKSGEHVVKLRDGAMCIVLGEHLVDHKSFLNLKHLNSDMEYYLNDELDVMEVYTIGSLFILDELSSGESLKLIWQRESPEEALKRIRKQELEEKVVMLRQELKQAENELQEL